MVIRADFPSPGSLKALAYGCTCPIVENNCGRGLDPKPGYVVRFLYDADCPFHRMYEMLEMELNEREQGDDE